MPSHYQLQYLAAWTEVSSTLLFPYGTAFRTLLLAISLRKGFRPSTAVCMHTFLPLHKSVESFLDRLCKGFYPKPFFKRHKKHCRGDTAAVACAVPLSLLLSDVQVNEDVPEFTREILSQFRGDDIGEVCRKDDQHRKTSKQDKKSQVRKYVMANMRRLTCVG